MGYLSYSISGLLYYWSHCSPYTSPLLSSLFTSPCGLFSFFNTAFNSTKKSQIQRNWQRCLSMRYPCLLHFSTFIPIYVMGYICINFSFPPRTYNCYVIGQLKLKHPWRKMFYGYKGTPPPNTTPLPPHTFPHNLLEEYRIWTSVSISLPSLPEHSCHLIFL